MFRTLASLMAGACLAAASTSAQTTAVLTTLRSFNGVNGQNPQGALTAGPDGTLYGVTSSGGTNNDGTVFSVTSDGTLTLLHSFSYSTDGSGPDGPLVLAADGNFYGTTISGGPTDGGGTVFQFAPSGVTTLHEFASNDAADGYAPEGGLSRGSDGSLYGTTMVGGSSNDGTIFRIGLDGTFTTLHAFNFHQTGAGPYEPQSPPIQGSDGNFYGVAYGGDNAVGAIYQMTPNGTVTTIYSFSKTDGASPIGPLVEGSPGVFYGVTASGGGSSGGGGGTIFKITSAGQLTTLHSFAGSPDGSTPASGLLLAADGNFYGTTTEGGASYGGEIYQCTPAGVVTSLHSFSDEGSTGGYNPQGGLVQASDGSFYGTTTFGGTSGDGTVYHLTFDAHPPFFDGEAALSNGVYYLQFSSGNYFGYYSFLSDPHYIYHFDLGYEYVFDAADGNSGVYLYDFRSKDFFYTSPTFPFPYLYDFGLNTVLYYYPNPKSAGHYNTNGIRYFYNFATGKVITK